MQAETSSKRTILITGGNRGLGYSIIDGLLAGETPYDIIFTSRNLEAGQKALEKLQNAHKESKSTVSVVQFELSDPASQEQLVDFIKNDRKKIDVLVNNSAIATDPETPSSRVETIDVNFLRTVELTEKLLPYLSTDGKVIMMSSGYGLLAEQGPAIRQQLEDPELSKEKLLQLTEKFREECKFSTHTESGFSESAYSASKAFLNAYTRWILVKLLKGEQQCYTLTPGWCRTDMGGPNATRSPEEGADTPIYLINLPFKFDKELNGKYFRDRQVTDF